MSLASIDNSLQLRGRQQTIVDHLYKYNDRIEICIHFPAMRGHKQLAVDEFRLEKSSELMDRDGGSLCYNRQDYILCKSGHQLLRRSPRIQ